MRCRKPQMNNNTHTSIIWTEGTTWAISDISNDESSPRCFRGEKCQILKLPSWSDACLGALDQTDLPWLLLHSKVSFHYAQYSPFNKNHLMCVDGRKMERMHTASVFLISWVISSARLRSSTSIWGSTEIALYTTERKTFPCWLFFKFRNNNLARNCGLTRFSVWTLELQKMVDGWIGEAVDSWRANNVYPRNSVMRCPCSIRILRPAETPIPMNSRV